MLNFKQIQCFLAVAQELHFSRAADRLGMAQSALSIQITRLEDELGTRLLSRGKRAAVSLTDPGRLFLGEARAAYLQLQKADRVGRQAARGQVGTVRLGYVASALTSGVLTLLLREFRAEHGDVDIQLTQLDTPSQISALADGRLDIGLIRPRTSYPDGVQAEVIWSEALEIALPADHPLTNQPRLRAQDFHLEHFIAPQYHDWVDLNRSLRKIGELGQFKLEPRFIVGDFLTAISMTSAGYGVMLAPASLKAVTRSGVAFRSVDQFHDEVQLMMAFKLREQARAVRALIDVARETRLRKSADDAQY